MDVKKIKPKKLYEQIAEIIEQQIFDQKVLPGEKLDSVEQLAKNFDVGRSAIREALTSLQAKGLLEIRQGEGTFVRRMSAEDITLHIPNYAFFTEQDIQQIFEVRKILELGLIENAVNRRTDAQLATLEEALHIMENALTDAHISSAADILFHHTISEAANNPLLVTMLENVSKPIAEQIQHTRELLVQTNVAALTQLHTEHVAIFEALKSQNTIVAKQAMAQHLSHVENLLFDFLLKHGNQ